MDYSQLEYPQLEYPQLEYPQPEYPQPEYPQPECSQSEYPRPGSLPLSCEPVVLVLIGGRIQQADFPPTQALPPAHRQPPELSVWEHSRTRQAEESEEAVRHAQSSA